MTSLLTVVAKIFSNTLIFLLQKCEYSHFCSKNINVFAIFQDRNLANNLSFEQLCPECENLQCI